MPTLDAVKIKISSKLFIPSCSLPALPDCWHRLGIPISTTSNCKLAASITLLFTYSINAIPLGTCEKAKACEYRELKTCS